MKAYLKLADKPISECELISYDGDRYCVIKCHDELRQINVGHIFIDEACTELVDYLTLDALPES